MPRMIWDTLTLLVSGLLLGAWLHARFGKLIIKGGWWDFGLGIALVSAVLGRFLRAIGALPLLVDLLGVIPFAVVVIAAVIAVSTNRPVDESTLGRK